MNRATYRRAARVLSSGSAKVAAANALWRSEHAKACAEIRAELANGADPRALYDAECAKGTARNRHRASALIGVLRRGLAALD